MNKKSYKTFLSKISLKTSGLSGVLSPVIAFIVISITIFLHPEFQWADYALSDLGAVGTAYNYIFNFGMIAAGFFALLFAINLYHLRNTPFGVVGTSIFSLGVIFLILIGIFPAGTSPHGLVSYGFFILCTVGMLLLGIDQLFGSIWIWGVFILSLVFSGISSFMLINTIPYPLDAAIPEVIGGVAFSQFCIVYGIRLLQKYR